MPVFNPTEHPNRRKQTPWRAFLCVLVLILTASTVTAANFITFGVTADRESAQLQVGAIKTFSNRTAAYVPLALGSNQTSVTPALFVTLRKADRITFGFTVGPEIDILSIPDDPDSKLTYLSAATGLACAYNAPLGLGLFAYIGYRPTDTPLPRLYSHAALMIKIP